MNFTTRWYLRVFAPIVMVCFFLVSFLGYFEQTVPVIKNEVLFLAFIGTIIFIASNHKVLIQKEYLIIKKGFLKRKIPYQKIYELDYRQRFGRMQSYFFEIKYRTDKNKKKSVFIDPTDFGMDSVIKIVDVMIKKNNKLSGFKSRFIE